MMPFVSINNLDRPLPAGLHVRWCASFWCRLRGLMFHPPFGREGGIVLVGKRNSRRDAAIHMFFMRMDLAVVWIDQNYRVVDVQLARRWHPVYTPQKPARYILELAPQWLPAFQVGDQLQFDGDALPA
jgi:uncharacterized membrane protein (UPF0127 family)